MPLTYYSNIVVVGVLIFFIRLFRGGAPPPTRKYKQLPFPKGPAPLPFLGNLHQLIPLTKSFLTFTTWSRSPLTSSDGGLLGLRLGGGSSRAVVLNKWTQVRDLFDARGRGVIYADRPYVTAAAHVLPPDPPGTDVHLVFAKYGPRWRRARRTIVEFLSEREVAKLVGLQDAESTQMMWELLQFCGGGNLDGNENDVDQQREQEGNDGTLAYHRYVMRYFGAVVLASVFGLRGKDSDPEGKIMRFFAIQDEWAAMLDQGATPPLDVFPWLRYIPDSLTPWRGWRKRAEALRKKQGGLYRELFAESETRIRSGRSAGCFLARLLESQEAAVRSGRDKDIYSQIELDYIGGFLMEGGADTTAMAFETFILAMAAYPEVQKRAQKEVDEMFGPQEMPHTADGNKLPFLKACFLEALRWRCPFPLAIPHANTADDIYHGYSIPKGTTIIPNIWAICHDPDDFENPDTYDPSRYLANPFGIKTKDGASDPGKFDINVDLPGLDIDSVGAGASEVSSTGRRQTYAFGAGRRICAGKKMAENSMIITMAKLMWSFDVLPGNDGQKPDVDVRTAYKDSILTGPNVFPVRFRLRDERKRNVIKEEWDKADEFLSRFE